MDLTLGFTGFQKVFLDLKLQMKMVEETETMRFRFSQKCKIIKALIVRVPIAIGT